MVTVGPLIGRESELAQLDGLLDLARLITVTGAGGCGKTRLALELADRVTSSRDALARTTVLLAGIASEDQLVDALLRALGARERFGSSPKEVLLDHVASRRLLLVLDNCEHIVAEVGRLAGELLGVAPDVRLLATSREPLAIDSEHVFRLGPLSLPAAGGSLSEVVRSDAGRLFVDRAAHNNPAFALTPSSASAVAEICRELDGVPLAIVLAAARLDTLSAGEIADGLSRGDRLSASAGDEEPSRHGSLRASLDWSYRLLDEHERVLLRGLSVFYGGFTASAARAIAAPELSETRVRELLGALEEKGLIVPVVPPHGQQRWRFLQTVAEYAAEQLAQEGEGEEVADRHLAHFLTYAARADMLLAEADGHERIEEETPNLRGALDRAIEHDPCSALRIAASLMRHWILAEHFQEARSISAAVLAAADGDGDAGARAVVLCGAGLTGLMSEDYAGAVQCTQAGLDLLGDVQDAGALSACLRLSSMVLIQTGLDLGEGLRNAERAVELARSIEDQLGLAFALVNLAVAAMLCERFDLLSGSYEEFMTIPRAHEHPRLRTWAEQAVAWAHVTVGSPQRALEHADLGIALEGEWPSMTHFQVLSFRVHALARLGRTDQALGEGADAMRRARESGALQAIPAIELALMVSELMHGDPDAAEIRAHRLLDMPHLHTLALARETLARIALIRGDAGEAETQARELEAIAERSANPRHRALADFIKGCAAVQAKEIDRGRDLLHAALETYAELALEREATDVLDELALRAAHAGEGQRAARLAAAAAAARARFGCAPWPGASDRLDAARARLSTGEQDGNWRAAWAQGQALSLTDAIAYARRGRGPRDRPQAGWASLTPVELNVAQLAASGITNLEIAVRLFIARGTVKMHLSNAYRKLGVANRVELATAMATHTSDLRASIDADPQTVGSP